MDHIGGVDTHLLTLATNLYKITTILSTTTTLIIIRPPLTDLYLAHSITKLTLLRNDHYVSADYLSYKDDSSILMATFNHF